jgi:hypothetical protein
MYERQDKVLLYIFITCSMIFYFYFFWPFQITLVINSMARIINKDGYPAELPTMTIKETFSEKWMFNYHPWSLLSEEVKALRDEEDDDLKKD